MKTARLDEARARIRIAGRNIINLRYADDTTLMAESKEELKGLLMKVKGESEKAVLKLNIQKTNIMVSSPITSWQIDAETMETVTDFSWAPKSTADSDHSHEIKRCLLLGNKVKSPALEKECESEVAQSCPTLCNPMDCSLPGSSIHGVFQASITRMGCRFLLQGKLPDPGIKPKSPAL